MWNNVTNHLGKCVLIDDTMLLLFLNDDFSDAGRNNVYIWKFWREREKCTLKYWDVRKTTNVINKKGDKSLNSLK